jgi:hypothetical protein
MKQSNIYKHQVRWILLRLLLLITSVTFEFCSITEAENKIDSINNESNLLTQILLFQPNLNCNYSPENLSVVNSVSSVSLTCDANLDQNTVIPKIVSDSYDLSYPVPNRLILQPKNSMGEGEFTFLFDFLKDSNGRNLLNANYSFRIDRTPPTASTEFDGKLIGTSDLAKGFIEINFSEKMLGSGRISNYQFEGEASQNLVISDIRETSNNQVRLFFLGEPIRTGGELILKISSLTDLGGNSLAQNRITLNLIGVKIVATLAKARRQLSSVLVNDRIYIIGGRAAASSATAFATLEVFNTKTLQIEKEITWGVGIAPALSEHKATALTDGRILIAGGRNTSGTSLNTSFFFNTETESFSVGPSLTGARRDFTLHSIGNRHYLIGGTGAVSNTIEVFSETTSTFQNAFTMQRSRATSGTGSGSICSSSESSFSVFGASSISTDVLETFNISNSTATASTGSVSTESNVVCRLGGSQLRYVGSGSFARIWNEALTVEASQFRVDARTAYSHFPFSSTQDILLGGSVGANAIDSILLNDWQLGLSKEIGKLNYLRSAANFIKMPGENRGFLIGGQYGGASYNIIEEVKW